MRNIVSLIAVAMAAMAIFWFVQHERKGEIAEIATDTLAASDEERAADVDQRSPSESPPNVIGESGVPEIDPETQLKIAVWQRSRGHYLLDAQSLPADYEGGFESIHPYTAYDDDTLRQLSDGGDMTATTMLADRFLLTDTKAGIALHQKAAAMGSTYSLLKLAAEHRSRQMAATEAAREENLVTALALYQVAVGRGDPAGLAGFNFASDGQQFTVEQGREICTKALVIRESLDAKRATMNLPPFDDMPSPIPESVRSMPLLARNLVCT